MWFSIAFRDMAGNTWATVTGTTNGSSVTFDHTSPTIVEVTAVPSTTNDTTPNYTFWVSENAQVSYSWACSSPTTQASSGNNTITFNSLGAGSYSNCQIWVMDNAWNTSTGMVTSSFQVTVSWWGGGGWWTTPATTWTTTGNARTGTGSCIVGTASWWLCSLPASTTTAAKKSSQRKAIVITPAVKKKVTDILTRCTKGSEEERSYCFAYAVGMTTKPTFAEARYNEQLTRAELANIMSQFDMSILGQSLSNESCRFTDVKRNDPSSDLPAHVEKSCKLYLMGRDSSGKMLVNFRPNDYVTRGEYMTALSRMIYGNHYELAANEVGTWPFYTHHMDKLYTEGIVKVKQPMALSARYVPFLTLYRYAQKL